MKRALAPILATLIVVSGCGGDDPPPTPYTYMELAYADIECDAQDIGAALRAHAVLPQKEKWKEGGPHWECLEDQLPDLTHDQLAHFADTKEAVKEYEFEAKFDDDD